MKPTYIMALTPDAAALEAFKRTLDEVKHTEATNTRSAWTDYQARMFFVDYGTILLNMLEKKD